MNKILQGSGTREQKRKQNHQKIHRLRLDSQNVRVHFVY